MTGLRAVLTEALAGKVAEAMFARHAVGQGFPADLREHDVATQSYWEAEAEAAIVETLDALDAAPGVAVTQLPEPSHAGTVSTSFRHVTYWHSVHQVRGEKRLITVDDPGRCMSADEARVLAADLLAAAAALSVEGNTNA